MRFSSREIRDILVSVLGLSLIFSYPEFIREPVFLMVSLLTVGIAFIGHELAHKFVAWKKGFFAEYRMWPQGLLMAVVFGLASGGAIIFAAPGAVYFTSQSLFRGDNRRDVGMVGIAGIAFNLALFFALVPLYLATGFAIFFLIARINVWLALFNLLPIHPLDGSKVLRWSRKAWGAAFALALLGYIFLIF